MINWVAVLNLNLHEDPKEAAAKARQDAWAAAQKAKAKNGAIVAKQREQEQRAKQDTGTYKGLKKSGVKVNIYGGSVTVV